MKKSTPNKMKNIERDLLNEMYLNQKLSGREIGLKLDVDKTAVAYWLKRYQIPTRCKNLRSPTFDISYLAEWERGYFAGFLDGEGSIVRMHYKGRFRNWRVSLGNTNFEIMKRFSDMLGYKILERHRENCQVFYSIAIDRAADVEAILKIIMPYLTIKKQQAQEALDWCRKSFEGSIVEVRVL